ncbi:MAG: M13 family peptidase, partial [Sphingomicrobium sp.]
FGEVDDRNEAALHEILEDARAGKGGEDPVMGKLGAFYGSCMDEAGIEKAGLSGIQPLLDKIGKVKDGKTLTAALVDLHNVGVGVAFGAGSEGDFADSSKNVLWIDSGGLGLPDRDYYLKNDDKLKEYREKYVGFVGNILGMAGDQSAAKSAREIFVLETRLARAHWTNVENRDAVKTYNKVAVADLAKQFPGFDWAAWTTELGVAGAPAIVVSQPSYLKALAASVNELSVDAWKPYLKASLLNGFAPYLNKQLVDAEFGFYSTTLRGVKEQQPRWKRAVNTLNGNMGEMLGKLYVERHFKPEAKARMEALVANLREAYRLCIDKLEWMGPETKKHAQEKLAKFQPKIGYPNKWRDYSKVEIRRDDLVGNMMRALEADSL